MSLSLSLKFFLRLILNSSSFCVTSRASGSPLRSEPQDPTASIKVTLGAWLTKNEPCLSEFEIAR